ncbi:MAG: hypothetical protein H0W48_00300 [Methylibium sp.]|nr:hypothetical protein [Methylibium sp.]
MRNTYTSDGLRELAKDKGPFFDGAVRAALCFAADVIDAAEVAIADNQAELLRLRKDAERYRWHRAHARSTWTNSETGTQRIPGELFDAATDAAMQQAAKEHP